MPFILSMERSIGEMPEKHGFHLGNTEWIARRIVEEKMQTCVENGWPMVTMALFRDGKIFDVLHRDGQWQSQLAVDTEPES